jgi:hypothetical protein
MRLDKGLLIIDFGGSGVMVSGNNNIIGVDGDGVDDSSEGNVIRDNGGHGVNIYNNATGNWLAGNLIGLTTAGTGDAGNAKSGVRIASGAHTNRIGTNGDGTSDELEGNVISGNDEWGIYITSTAGGYNVVAGNRVGTSAAGDAAIPNTRPGVFVFGSNYNRVGTDGDGLVDDLEGNVISGNNDHGLILNTTAHNVIAGNYIGTNAAGDAALPNARSGLYLSTSANNRIGTDGDGTSDELERNVISGNGEAGIALNPTTTSTVIAGNYVGVNAAGDTAIANGDEGVLINNNSTNNLIGTDADGTSDDLERNLISGNGAEGIMIMGGSDGNTVAGNYIGVNAAGDAAIPNGEEGVEVRYCANNRIGGTAAAERNLISGNSSTGVYLFNAPTGNLVQGNYIGTDASGNDDLGNGEHGVSLITDSGSSGNLGDWEHGLSLPHDAAGNTIGGTTIGAANRIAFNGGVGIRVHKPTSLSNKDNPLRGNIIFANGGLGIDLDPNEGVTANDAGDGDSGANNLQNYPLLSSAGSDGSQILIEGVLNSSSNTTFALDFYANSGCDPSGYGEGEIYLDTDTVTANASGGAIFSVALQGSVPAGYYATATATDPDGNTSEFSQCLLVAEQCFPADDADFDWTPTTPAIGQLVTFTGEASGTLPINLVWSFGDTAVGAGSTVTHTYNATGDYPVSMTAVNQCGTNIISHTLTVGDLPPDYEIFLPLVCKNCGN